MTYAVLFATAGVADSAEASGTPAALFPLGDRTVLSRLVAQLAATGVERAVVLAHPGDAPALRAAGFEVGECQDVRDELRAVARVARAAPGRLVLCAADLVAADSVVKALVGSARHRDTALVGRLSNDALPYPVVVAQRGRVVQVGAGPAPGTAAFRGLLVAGSGRVTAAAEALLAPESVPAEAAVAPDQETLTALLTMLVVGDHPMAAHRIPGLTYGRVIDAESATALVSELESVNEDEVRLRLAVKRQDDLFATYAVSSYSPYLVRWAARWGLSPTVVTWVSVLVALLASVALAQGERPFLILGALGVYLSFVLDCVDGQLARYLHDYSRFGGWLDTIADRSKEYLVYAALAVGAARSGVGDVWPLAIAAMVLLTVRHMTDSWYGTLQDEAVARRSPERPTASEGLRQGLTLRLGAALGEVSDRVQSSRASLMYWLKRTVPLPIGERWMLIGVATAVFDARVALIALLSWGGVAAAYTFTGRVLRSRAVRMPVMVTVSRPLHRDDGMLASLLGGLGRGVVPPLIVSALPALVALLAVTPGPWRDLTPVDFVVMGYLAVGAAALAAGHRHSDPLHWLVPAALRASEAAIVLLVGWYAAVPLPLIFVLLAVLAVYHYDLTARLERRGSPLVWRSLGLGWDGRLVVLGVAALSGLAAEGVAALAGYLAVIFVGGSLFGAVLSAERRVAPVEPLRLEVPLAGPVPADGRAPVA
ncbi:MAG TPA: CDP-alcohol phosphatidyltransferase family protein [Micromonosporaceae bacterium]|nr:CDP-alcohol phosphatidyltransferase family protein [Micromonosporaceae bacterium]